MFRKFAIIGVLTLFVAACGGTAASVAPEESEAAAPADAVPADARTVNLEIGADAITPAIVAVKKGETIAFVAKNISDAEVELIVGTQTDVDADSGDSLKEAEEIAPGASKTVVYTFDGDGPYAFGDQIDDHYANGAKGTIDLQP